MKILHIIDSLAAGGAEKLIEESIPILNQYDDIKVEVLLLTDKNNIFDKKLKEFGIKIKVIPYRKIYSPRNILYIRKFVIQGKYDIVHVHLFPCNYWTSLAFKVMQINKPKLITTEHSTHNKRRSKPYFRIVEKFIYSSYDAIISISEGTQYNLIKWITPKNKDKFIVIENGIDQNKFINAKPYKKSNLDKEFNESTKIICMIGSFSIQKDQATIIRAMQSLPNDVFLLLVGDGPLINENKNLAIKLNVDNRVKFLGIREDVPKIIKTSDVIIVSSHWEGFGLVAVEGMAAGKPVIASEVPGLAEVVKDAGVLFERGNEDELSNKINDLLANNVEYNRIQQRCLIKSQKYSITSMVEGYMNLYKSIATLS